MKEFYKNKRILITGGAGSVGSELVFQIQKLKPKEIIILDKSEYGIHKLANNPRYIKNLSKIILIDIKNFIHLKEVLTLEKPNIIIHAAAYKHLPILQENPSEAILNNVMATKNLVDLCGEINIERFLFVSTDKAVCPSSNLGVSKYLAERIIRYKDNIITKFYTVRFGNIYKSSGSVVEVFEQQIRDGIPLTITNYNAKRFYIKLEKACLLLLQTLTIDEKNEIFIFEMGEPRKTIDILKEVATNNKLQLTKGLVINQVGLREGEKLEEILINDYDAKKKTKFQNILQVIENPKFKISSHKINQLVNLAKQRKDLALSKAIDEIINTFKK